MSKDSKITEKELETIKRTTTKNYKQLFMI